MMKMEIYYIVISVIIIREQKKLKKFITDENLSRDIIFKK